MRKVALLAASALLVPGVAFADGEEMSPMSPMFVGVSVGWTQMDMPEHQNGAITFNFGGGFEPLTEQADVDGVTYAIGIGKDLTSGWRVGAYARFFDGEGSSASSFAIPNATPFRRGTLDGTLQLAGAFGGAATATHTLDVHVNDYAVAVSAGHGLGSMLRGDLIVSYGATETEYQNAALDTLNELFTTNTAFTSNTTEIAGRLSAAIPLSDDFSLSLGGSVGWGLRNIDMNARQRFTTGAIVTSDSSIGQDEDVDGLIGRLDAAFGYNLARSTTIALTANYVYDDMVPVYLAPVYPPAGVGTAATFTTEGQSSMTYGLRVIGRF
ncbi:MAG: hypothetical protein ACKVRO_08230 [Micropepsaceae bacterium]